MGTISYWKPNHLLIGALELKFQVLSQHPQKFLTGRGGWGVQLKLCSACICTVSPNANRFPDCQEQCPIYCWQLPTKRNGDIIQSHRVRTSVPTFSATNVHRQNTEQMKQRLQNSQAIGLIVGHTKKPPFILVNMTDQLPQGFLSFKGQEQHFDLNADLQHLLSMY